MALSYKKGARSLKRSWTSEIRPHKLDLKRKGGHSQLGPRLSYTDLPGRGHSTPLILGGGLVASCGDLVSTRCQDSVISTLESPSKARCCLNVCVLIGTGVVSYCAYAFGTVPIC